MSERILIVDDDPATRIGLAELLTEAGYETRAIATFEEGLRALRSETPDLLIADVRSGIQVAAEEGVATKTDFGVSGWSWGGGDYTRLGGYTNTPEGKMVAASLLDNYNRIVARIRSSKGVTIE